MARRRMHSPFIVLMHKENSDRDSFDGHLTPAGAFAAQVMASGRNAGYDRAEEGSRA